MLAYLIRRIIGAAIVIFLAALVTYLLFNIAPGGPLTGLAQQQQKLTPQDIARIRAQYELDLNPIVRFSRWLGIGLALQIGLFVAWIGLGAGPSGAPGFGALVGPWALFVWLRLLVGLVFPLIVSWAAIQTARSRSMESATGLLYINVGTIAAGTILAAGLYFGAGLLV